MEKLMDHTLRRQMTEQATKMDEQAANINALQTQVAELTTLLKSSVIHAGAGSQVHTGEIHAGAGAQVTAVASTGPVTNNYIYWDGGKRINVDTAHIIAAYAENPQFQQYAGLDERQQVDREIAPPYVAALLMDATKRAHTDPAARNVYLNPRRADQALVHMTSGRWEVISLAEASRLLLDGVVASIHRITLSYAEATQLPVEARSALAAADMMYGDEPETYVERTKTSMSAHLANMAPRFSPKTGGASP